MLVTLFTNTSLFHYCMPQNRKEQSLQQETTMSADQPTLELVEAELAKSPSSTSHKSLLEAFVDVQAAAVGGTDPVYLFEANKALVKIYQFLPHTANTDKIATIVLLSMIQYPTTTTDRLALSYVIPDRMQQVEPTASALRCSTLFDECRFAAFWEAYSKLATTATDSNCPTLQALLAGPGTAALQRSILQTMALTYKSAKLESVLASLNMTSADTLTALKEPCVESVSNNAVNFVGTVDNTKRKRVFQEGVSYTAIANMMAKVVASPE
jgi:translation initiation factor 3 subunit K